MNYNDSAGLAKCQVVGTFTTIDENNEGYTTMAEIQCLSAGHTVQSTTTIQNYDGNYQEALGMAEASLGAELDTAELERVELIAEMALQSPDCRGLFHGNTNPAQFLDDLIHGRVGGSSLGFRDLGPPIGNLVTAALTSPTLGSKVINGVRMSVFTGATITINSNDLAPWVTGYPDRFGFGSPTTTATQDAYRAITLIHELGHYFADVTGMGGSDIVDDGLGSAPGSSQRNTQLVFDNCFK